MPFVNLESNIKNTYYIIYRTLWSPKLLKKKFLYITKEKKIQDHNKDIRILMFNIDIL